MQLQRAFAPFCTRCAGN